MHMHTGGEKKGEREGGRVSALSVKVAMMIYVLLPG
jgi:hypothetical protein